MRLAAQTEPGATMLNAYSYLVQIAGLYAHASPFDHRPFGRKRWLELSEHTLSDLGPLYALWEAALQDESASAALGQDLALFRRVETLCRRSEILVNLLDVWTSSRRWVSVMARLERKWCHISRDVTVHAPDFADAMAGLQKSSLERQSLLQGLASQLENEAATYQEVAAVMLAQKRAK